MPSRCVILFSLLPFGCTPAGTEGVDSTARSNRPPSIDSESHFLSFCARGCADGLRCVCGVCTRVCDQTRGCDDLGDAVGCVPPTAAEPTSCVLTPVRTVCDAHCELDADCAELGQAYVCDSGVCRTAPPAHDACGSVMTPACSADQELVVAFDENGCATLSCGAVSSCPSSFLSAGQSCDAPAREQFWFNAATGRCEVHDVGNCPTTINSFDTLEQCWEGCAPTFAGTCIEGWDPNFDMASVELVAPNNLRLGPSMVRKEQALALFGEPRHATLTYPDGTQTALTMTASDLEAYHVMSVDNPMGSAGGIGPHCWDTVAVEADVHFISDDGRFDEHWQRVRFTVNEWDAFASLELWATGDWSPLQPQRQPLSGSYRNDLPSGDYCSLSTGLHLNLVTGSFSGSIQHTVVALPCDQVTDTTPIGNDTPATPPPRAMAAPVPSGPVWNALVGSVNGQFCTAASPNRRGPKEPGDSLAAAALYDDPQPDDRLANEAAGECSLAGASACDPAQFVTIWAAECVARAEGLEVGIAPWQSVLRYDEDMSRVAWNISTTLRDDGEGNSSGATMTLDAITAEVIGTSEWDSVPVP